MLSKLLPFEWIIMLREPRTHEFGFSDPVLGSASDAENDVVSGADHLLSIILRYRLVVYRS